MLTGGAADEFLAYWSYNDQTFFINILASQVSANIIWNADPTCYKITENEKNDQRKYNLP